VDRLGLHQAFAEQPHRRRVWHRAIKAEPQEALERHAILHLELDSLVRQRIQRCSTRILNMSTGSNGGRPPLPRGLRSSAATSVPRNTSKSTTVASHSSRSPAALSCSYRVERSKKPGCPTIAASLRH